MSLLINIIISVVFYAVPCNKIEILWWIFLTWIYQYMSIIWGSLKKALGVWPALQMLWENYIKGKEVCNKAMTRMGYKECVDNMETLQE